MSLIEYVDNTFSAENISDYFKSEFGIVDIDTVYNELVRTIL